MSENTFEIIMLNGRPASGKSEIIDYIKKAPIDERISKLHIEEFEEIDDFPMLWTWFEEDAIIERLGLPRLHTDAKNNFKDVYLWDVLCERLSLEYEKFVIEMENAGRKLPTSIIEFSRGTQHGGYERAYAHISDEILKKAAILYVNVSWDESLRKNRKRFNPKRAHSILEHSVDEDKLRVLYENDDFHDFTSKHPEYVEIRGIKVPFVVFENEDDVTTARGEALGNRLEETLATLWKRYKG